MSSILSFGPVFHGLHHLCGSRNSFLCGLFDAMELKARNVVPHRSVCFCAMHLECANGVKDGKWKDCASGFYVSPNMHAFADVFADDDCELLARIVTVISAETGGFFKNNTINLQKSLGIEIGNRARSNCLLLFSHLRRCDLLLHPDPRKKACGDGKRAANRSSDDSSREAQPALVALPHDNQSASRDCGADIGPDRQTKKPPFRPVHDLLHHSDLKLNRVGNIVEGAL